MRGTAGLSLPLLVPVVVVALLHAASGAGAAVGGGCDRRCGGMELPYPFGFSSGCTIRLGCDAGIGVAWLGGALELGLLVRNVTPRSIIIDLQPDCSRRFNTSVAALFSDSYAPASRNMLVVSSFDDCANINNCSITPDSFINRTSSHCSANESIRCIQAPLRSGHHFLNRSELLRSNCTGLVSSISYSDAMGPALMLGALQLDWWVPGRCRCSPGANCTQFTAPTTGQEAFRCECQDGLEGDGFIYGTGCWLTGTASSGQQRVPFGVFAAVTAIAVVLLVLSISACLIFRRCRRRNTMKKTKQPLKAVSALFRGELVDDELGQGAAGPRRFSYDDLAAATGNFSEDRALGRGGFGSVYRGFLSDMNREVAVKRVSGTSRQGWKEFVSEVSIISRLRHRNLVQLIG
uniref:Protein kinase domain-containing protein n=1 Tax=Aegilops tauschii subsp. strangulata TaxID=200361 RepID=A0A453JQ70_AEGTS